MKKLFSVTVTGNTYSGPDAFILSFKRNFDFVAGQVIGITLDSREEPRLYSIASGVNQSDVWILYTIKPDGALTPQLARVMPGDTIYITEPFGNFICNDDKAIWIATGTGIAPFASMFFSGQYYNKILIQGSRNKQGLYFFDHFTKQMPEHYKPCCSRDSDDDCFTGRVSHFLEATGIPDPDIPYYLCGSAEMVVDVRDLLIEKGVPFNNIMAEIFF